MADPRRSARSTKGVNSRLSDINVVEFQSPTPAKRRKSTPKQSSPVQEGPQSEDDGGDEDKSDDIIRCVCGAIEEDEDDDRMMIQCEGCDAWQHTLCMGIPKRKIPKQYFCEVCRPEQHKFLLGQMALGEKPWERKGGKRKKAQAKATETTPAREKRETSTATEKEKTDKEITSPEAAAAINAAVAAASAPRSEEVVMNMGVEKPVYEDKMDIDSAEPQLPPTEPERNGDGQQDRMDRDATIPAEDMPPPPPPPPLPVEAKTLPSIITESPAQKQKTKKEAVEKPTTPSATTPKSAKRKQSHDSDGEYKVDENKQPQQQPAQHTEKRQRRASLVPPVPEATTPKPDRRRSSAAIIKPPPPVKKAKDDITPQKELVNSISELRNHNRVNIIQYLITCMSEHAKRLVDDKKITLQPDSTVEALCENRALQVEHHVYLIHFIGGQIGQDYHRRMRTIGYNLKSNPSLSDEILGGRLSCERLSKMTTEEMASKELQELTQQVRLESEKHNTLINETGPRIRRTHKGEELVNEETSMQSGQDTLLGSGAVIRRPTEIMDELPPITTVQSDSPVQPTETSMSPTTAGTALETPRSPSQPVVSESSEPPPEKTRSFSIENVWSHVESPDTERRPPRPPAQPLPTARPIENKIDKDIDMLLKDDDQDAGTPPYSPASYDDHYSPKPDQHDDTVWRGRVDMNQIANLNATASILGGPETIGDKHWFELLDSVLNIDGRIKHERATEYLCGQKFSKSSSMILASLKPEHSANQVQFDRLFDYFKAKDRYAVVGKHNLPCIKDLYVVPIDSNETLPDWFNVVDPPSKVPEKSRSSRILVLIFVVIRGLVPGHVEDGNGASARRFSTGFGTPQQPLASPYAPTHPHISNQQQPYQASPLSHPQPSRQHMTPQQQPYSPSPVGQAPPQQTHYGNQHSPVQYGYPPQHHQQQQQQYPQLPPQYQHPPQQHPLPLPPLQLGPIPHPFPQTQHQQPLPQQHQPTQLPRQQQTTQLSPPSGHQQQPVAYVPKHPMTRQLINIIPKLGEMQARAIDKLLQENPELETKPDVLAKEVEKVLGA